MPGPISPIEMLVRTVNKERHSVLLDAFGKLWLKTPNKRFGKLVSDVMNEDCDYWELMEISDERYIEKIKEMLGT